MMWNIGTQTISYELLFAFDNNNDNIVIVTAIYCTFCRY